MSGVDFVPVSPWHRQRPQRDRAEAWASFWDVLTTAIARAVADGALPTSAHEDAA